MPKILEGIYDYSEEIVVEGKPEPGDEGLALAINLIDLERVPPTVREQLFGHGLFLLHPRPIWMDTDKMEETGLSFACSLLQGAAICDYLREHDRKSNRTVTRIYLRKVRAWQKLPADAILVKYGKLNPAIFPPERAVVVQPSFPTRARKLEPRRLK